MDLAEGVEVAFVDMAHSHVQRLLREAFEGFEPEQDDDGDYGFRYGSAMVWITVHPQGRLVKVWSFAATGVRPTKAVLQEANDLNVRLSFSRAFAQHGRLELEAIVPVEELTVKWLKTVVLEIAEQADSTGSMVAAVHGGSTCFEPEELETG